LKIELVTPSVREFRICQCKGRENDPDETRRRRKMNFRTKVLAVIGTTILGLTVFYPTQAAAQRVYSASDSWTVPPVTTFTRVVYRLAA
jgi:hypothetical protein